MAVNKVMNQGADAAPASTVTFYLSSDSTITTGDIKLTAASVASLSANASQTVTVSAVIPSTTAPGSYYIGAIADAPGVVAESVETNNATAGNAISMR